MEETRRDSADATEEATLSAQVRATVGRLYRRFRAERPEGALGDKALEVLTFLEKHGPHSLTELSEIGEVAPATMSQSVNRLTSAGYAVRAKDEADRRKVLFRATSAGRDLAAATRLQRDAWLENELSRFSSRDRSVIARACVLLQKVADS
ncbi:MarR family transcriptional regulator [Frondihabitans sucicola]|uniref:MarR family transcriptional regulator n=1 Tax=Frondihabitans sucicola TaxID=1268041 RepID=A0ABN6XVK9_9MICO|nr:MarR family transcriptional regulator [Frondihabitans sucicola]BDZ47927.1 MarR family transcriptional regulator [Frondihabitans sucicola]